MSRPLDCLQSQSVETTMPSAGGTDDAIQDYLDYLCAPLLGVVPYAQRRRLRAEAEDHLLALAEDFQAEGFAPAEAVGVALREYGEPWGVGQAFADAWLGGASPTRLARLADAATLRAFGWFGVLTVLDLLLLEWAVLGGGQDWLLLAQVVAVLSPLAAGAVTGAGLDSRAASGTCRAVGVLGLASAAVGLLLRPHQEGLTFAAFQFLFWVPVGCLSASVAASLRRQFLLRGFLRAGRPSRSFPLDRSFPGRMS